MGLADQGQGIALGIGGRLGVGWFGAELVPQAPQPPQEFVHSGQRALRPRGVLIRRPDEQDVTAGGVSPVAVDDRRRADHVAGRLRHLLAVWAEDHPLREQRLKWLLHVEQVEVGEGLDEEPRVHQVQDRVLDAADVLIDGHPALQGSAVPGRLVVARVAVAQEIPRRVDEGVHRVGLPARRSAALRARRPHPVLGSGER